MQIFICSFFFGRLHPQKEKATRLGILYHRRNGRGNALWDGPHAFYLCTADSRTVLHAKPLTLSQRKNYLQQLRRRHPHT